MKSALTATALASRWTGWLSESTSTRRLDFSAVTTSSEALGCFGSAHARTRLLPSASCRGRRVSTTSPTETGCSETREARGQFGIEFENSDEFDLSYQRSYEFLEEPFPIASDVTIPIGGYQFQDVRVSFTLGQQRRFSGTLSVQHGSFFSGDKTTVGFSRGRLELTPQLSVEPSLSYNRVVLPEGRFTTQLVTTRTTYTMTP